MFRARLFDIRIIWLWGWCDCVQREHSHNPYCSKCIKICDADSRCLVDRGRTLHKIVRSFSDDPRPRNFIVKFNIFEIGFQMIGGVFGSVISVFFEFDYPDNLL